MSAPSTLGKDTNSTQTLQHPDYPKLLSLWTKISMSKSEQKFQEANVELEYLYLKLL